MARSLESILRSAQWRAVDPADARETWARFRREHYGYSTVPDLIRRDPTAKIAKGSSTVNYGLTLRPAEHDYGDGLTVESCPFRTPECTAACVLETAGNARYASVARSRDCTTEFAAREPAAFLALLYSELRALAREHRSRVRGRLNIASDVRWERILPLGKIHALATAYKRTKPYATFYDYTKWPMAKRTESGAYRLTYSVSERPESLTTAHDHVAAGGNAAVVLDVKRGHAVPTVWRGLPMIDGDKTDDRTTDPRGAWIALRAKGAAMGDYVGGFVHAA